MTGLSVPPSSCMDGTWGSNHNWELVTERGALELSSALISLEKGR